MFDVGSPATSSAAVPDAFNAAAWFVDRNVHEGRGAATAIECGNERIAYGEVAERVNRFASALRDAYGVRPEERVVLLLLDTPAFAAAFFGAIKAGAVAVPVNTLWKPADYQYVLNDTRARVLVVSSALLPAVQEIPSSSVPWLRHIVVDGSSVSDGHRACEITTFDAALEQGAPVFDTAPTHKDDAAFWLYSSGSTGFPKGCVHLHHDMVVCAAAYAQGVLGMSAADRCFSVAKLFFAYGLGNALYMPFSVGGTSILWPGPPTPADVFATIRRHRPTLFFSVPTGYAMLLAHEPPPGVADFDLSSIRHAVSAGESLAPALYDRFKQRFGIDILDGIGSTETLHMFISNRPDRIRPGSSGVLIAGYEARILDEQKQPVAAGEIGNLYVKGDSICSQYWNKHEKTKDTIEGHWIRTGDKFSQDGDGFFWYRGRSDDMLKVGGQWVSPVEVENVLARHEAVQECAVVGWEDAHGLVKPYAFVVVRSGVVEGDTLAQQLKQFVREQLAEYKRPRAVEFVAELPKTATGKIQRYKLRDRLRTSTPANDPNCSNDRA
jgi:benzoate-CoA ligase